MKMVVNFADKTGKLNRNQLEHSIRRNFGGFDPETGFDPMVIFSEYFTTLDTLDLQEDGRPPIDSIGLIKSSLSGKDTAMKGWGGTHNVSQIQASQVVNVWMCDLKIHVWLIYDWAGLIMVKKNNVCLWYQINLTFYFINFRMESRYLLILTENLSVLSIILNEFSSHDRQPEVVFGSKFREDVSFTQVSHQS